MSAVARLSAMVLALSVNYAAATLRVSTAPSGSGAVVIAGDYIDADYIDEDYI